MIEKISSLQNPRIKSALKLHSSRGRKSQERFILFGNRQVSRAVQSGYEIEELFLRESAQEANAEILETIASSTAAFLLGEEVFGKLMFGDRNDNVIGVAKRPQFGLSDVKLEERPLVLVCQSIEKPGNLGAILRSADACGVSAVMAVDPLTDFYHPNTIRASTGAVFSLQTAVASSQEVQEWLGENQFKVFTAQLDGASSLFQQDLAGNVAFVMGNEAEGLDSKWSSAGYTAICLPMLGIADSLNVSVTASVMLYEAMRQRTRK